MILVIVENIESIPSQYRPIQSSYNESKNDSFISFIFSGNILIISLYINYISLYLYSNALDASTFNFH